MKIGTKVLSSTGTVTISASDGVQSVSIQADSASAGQCTVTGAIPFQTVASGAILLQSGGGMTIQNSTASTFPLDGITITWLAGTVNIIFGY